MTTSSSKNGQTKKTAILWGIAGLLLFTLTFFLVWRLPRGQDVPQRPVDLSGSYNAGTTNSTQDEKGNNGFNNLAEFPTGTNQFAGVQFSVGGIIQLAWRDNKMFRNKFPTRVDGIPVGANCRRLHLLHGTARSPGSGSQGIAYLEVHYTNGQSAQIPILYGHHVRDWWVKQGEEEHPPKDPGSQVAWYGSNPEAVAKNYKLRIFKSTFDNPYPLEQIGTIDYVSTMTMCAPFLLGLTLE